MAAASTAEWPDEFTPDVLEQIITRAIKEADFDSVSHALRLLAVRDPHRAELIFETLKVGVALRQGDAR